MLNKLRTRTLLWMLFPVLLLAVIGICLFAESNLFAEEPTPQNLYEVPRDELEGAYVTVDVEWIYGCYAYTEETRNNIPTGKITEREYVIDANADDYMALILSGDLMDKAEALMAECDNYYNGGSDEITQSFTVSGYVKKLPSDSLDFYHEALDYYSMSFAEREIVLPLYLAPANFELNVIVLIISLVCIGVAVLLLVLVFQGRFQRQITEKLNLMFGDNPERQDEFLNHMLNKAPNVGGMRMDNGYIYLCQGVSHYLFDSRDLVWAYEQVTRQKLYGIITVGKNYGVALKMADGTSKMVSMPKKKVNEMLHKIAEQFPGCVIGYSDELAALYNQNRAAMANVAAAQRSRSSETM